MTTLPEEDIPEEDIIEDIPSEKEDKQIGVPLYKIVSYPADYTIQGLHDKWNEGEIIIPSFQRGWVWKHPQASRLIDSFLLGLPVPSIFLYKEPSQRHLVIDGQQRLRTIWGFLDNQLPDENKPFFLKNVSPQWEGLTYETLEESDRRRLRNAVLRAVIVEQLDPADDSSIYHIFERLNTGGTGLNPQEVRNCVSHGPFNDLVIELNKNTDWRNIFGNLQPDKRMRDIELLIRFLALYSGSEGYQKPMKEFLNKFMHRHQLETSKEPYLSIFTTSVQRIIQHLGPRPFHLRRGINAAVFDSVTVAFARADSIPGDIKTRYQQLLQNLSFEDSTTDHTTDVDIVGSRIRLAQEILFG